MRNTDMLRDMRNVHILQNWLYADETHSVTVENCIGAKITLTMNDEGEVMAVNQNANDQTPFHYDSMLSIPIWLGIIEQLEEQKPEISDEFTSRWEEIKTQWAIIKTINANIQ